VLTIGCPYKTLVPSYCRRSSGVRERRA